MKSLPHQSGALSELDANAGDSVAYTMMDGNASDSLINSSDDQEALHKLLVDKNDEYSRAQLPVFVICGVLMFIGIVGNSLVIHVYWRSVHNSSKKTFILALALLDLSVCVFVIPFEIYDLRNQLMFYSAGICKAMRLLEYSTVVAAALVLVSVSFERYYFLCKAFQMFTPRKSKIICAVCVLVAILVASPSGIFAGLRTRTEVVGNVTITGSECSMDSGKAESGFFKRVYYYVLALIFIVCILFLLIIYSVIARILAKYRKGELIMDVSVLPKRLGKQRASRDDNSGYSECSSTLTKHQSNRHVGKLHRPSGSIIVFFSVTLVFILSFLPHIVIRILLFFDPTAMSQNLVYNLVVRSYLISNVTNPFIYSILNHTFRKQLKRTFIKMSGCFYSGDRRATVV